jgi:Zn-dependent oligopeptidase
VAYDNKQMSPTRRSAVFLLTAGPVATLARAQALQLPEQPPLPLPNPPDHEEDRRLPNGRSQKDAIAKQEHQQALKDTDNLIAIAQQLKSELEKAGDYVIPLSCVKKTEEIERLARKIRGRLKG